MTLVDQLASLLTAARGDEPRTTLADRLNVSDVALAHVEHGRANPTLNRVDKLAADYGIRVAIVNAADLVTVLKAATDVDAHGLVDLDVVARLTAATQETRP